jgi:hypothetical protein
LSASRRCTAVSYRGIINGVEADQRAEWALAYRSLHVKLSSSSRLEEFNQSHNRLMNCSGRKNRYKTQWD